MNQQNHPENNVLEISKRKISFRANNLSKSRIKTLIISIGKVQLSVS